MIHPREHVLVKCEAVMDVFEACKEVLKSLLEKNLRAEEIIHLAFNHRCKRRLTVGIWFAVKAMYMIYHKNNRNKMQLLREIIKELEWNLDQNRKVGSVQDMIILKDKIKIVLGIT